MNWTGDLTDEEFHHSQGVNSSLAEQASHEDNDNDRRLLQSYDASEGRHLQDRTIYSKNWVKENKVGDVKSQGNCGSCWAFAATTCQEAMQAIKDNESPVQLSEQEAVDCTTQSGGCNGGWMTHYWKFSNEKGSQPVETYQYEAITNDECMN